MSDWATLSRVALWKWLQESFNGLGIEMVFLEKKELTIVIMNRLVN